MFIATLYNLKGGVGKTASCVNFAYLSAMEGYKTLIWDLDPQGAASYYYNATANAKGNYKKIINSTSPLANAIQSTAFENLDIIPADISARKLDVLLHEHDASKKKLYQLLRQLTDYDFIFIDAPPGFSTLADNIFYASDALLMPVIPTTLSLRTYEIVKQYFIDKKIGLDKLACFFSMVDIRKNMHKEVIRQLLKDRFFFEHYIPYLSDIEKMGVKQAPVVSFAKSSFASVCYQALWEEIKEGVLA